MTTSTAKRATTKKIARAKKDKMINVRVQSHTKDLFDKAADLLGVDTSSFIIATVSEKAQEVLKEHEQIVLSERDFASFLAALDNPPKPNEALRKAVKKHA